MRPEALGAIVDWVGFDKMDFWLGVEMENGRDAGLLEAARCGCFLTAFQKLKQGADANARDAEGAPALALAAHAQANPDILRVLLYYGADPKAVDGFGETALMKAARRGDPDSVRVLLPVSDAQARNMRGITALHLVLASGNVEAASMLLEASAASAWESPLELLSLCKSERLRKLATVEMEKKLLGSVAAQGAAKRPAKGI